MKKGLSILFFAVLLFAGSVSANGKNNKAHLNAKTKDGGKINCVYCHQTAGFQKKKGQDLAVIDTHQYCAGNNCHPVKKK